MHTSAILSVSAVRVPLGANLPKRGILLMPYMAKSLEAVG